MNAVEIATLPRIAAREFLCGEVLALDAASGAAQLRYRVSEMHLNLAGTAFGGFLAAMIDDAAGLAAWFGARQRPFATVTMTVNFLSAARVGDALLADVLVTQSGSRQAFIEVRLAHESSQRLVATATVVQSFLA